MDKIKKYKRQLLHRIITTSVVGIIVFGIAIRDIRAGHSEVATALLLTSWIAFYIDYVMLKSKIEILKEIRGEEYNKPNKEN